MLGVLALVRDARHSYLTAEGMDALGHIDSPSICLRFPTGERYGRFQPRPRSNLAAGPIEIAVPRRAIRVKARMAA